MPIPIVTVHHLMHQRTAHEGICPFRPLTFWPEPDFLVCGQNNLARIAIKDRTGEGPRGTTKVAYILHDPKGHRERRYLLHHSVVVLEFLLRQAWYARTMMWNWAYHKS